MANVLWGSHSDVRAARRGSPGPHRSAPSGSPWRSWARLRHASWTRSCRAPALDVHGLGRIGHCSIASASALLSRSRLVATSHSWSAVIAVAGPGRAGQREVAVAGRGPARPRSGDRLEPAAVDVAREVVGLLAGRAYDQPRGAARAAGPAVRGDRRGGRGRTPHQRELVEHPRGLGAVRRLQHGLAQARLGLGHRRQVEDLDAPDLAPDTQRDAYELCRVARLGLDRADEVGTITRRTASRFAMIRCYRHGPGRTRQAARTTGARPALSAPSSSVTDMQISIGAHVEQTDPIAEAVARETTLVQFFLGDPQGYKGPEIRYEGGADALRGARRGRRASTSTSTPPTSSTSRRPTTGSGSRAASCSSSTWTPPRRSAPRA